MSTKGYQKKSKPELLAAIDNCVSISQLFALVQHEDIDIRMQSLSSASCIPLKVPDINASSMNSPLDRLKTAVRNAVEATR